MLNRLEANDLEGVGTLGSLTARKDATPKVDLRQRTYELLPFVRKPLKKEKEALGEQGFDLLWLPVKTESYAQVVAQNPAFFWDGQVKYAKSETALRDIFPVATEVGFFNPVTSELALPDSFYISPDGHLQKIDDYSLTLSAEFPEARAIMLPVTAYAQADMAYQNQTGEGLFINFFARALDILSGAGAANAGRANPKRRFGVGGWVEDFGSPRIGAVPGIVFVQNEDK